MKYSIIVPVYNVEKYLRDCFDSILAQTYEKFEVIVVNDGSPDNSQDIIDEYKKKDKRIKSFKKENGGLSSARNFGMTKAKGDFLVFVDSDDTINKELLENINKHARKDVDIIRFRVDKVEENKHNVEETPLFEDIKGTEAFKQLVNEPLFVTAWSSAYNSNYFRVNKFTYSEGRIHEDFGLTPIVYFKANKVTSIDYVGYNYFIRTDSIMTSKIDDKKITKRNKDVLYQYDKLMKYIDKSNGYEIEDVRIYKSFLANSLINRCTILEGKVLEDYLEQITKRGVSDYMIDDTAGRRCKKMFFKVMPRTYINLYLKK